MTHPIERLKGFLNRASKPGQITNKTKFTIAFPHMPVSLSNALIHLAYIKFYTDMVGLDVRYVGILYMLFGIWNAINDPMLGVFIDRFKTYNLGYRTFFKLEIDDYCSVIVFRFRIAATVIIFPSQKSEI